MVDMSNIGALRFMSTLIDRMRFSGVGKTFGGVRDMWNALGYKRELGAEDYERRFKRGGIAKRIVTIHPKATWAAGCEVVESPKPFKMTPFEQACRDLDAQVHFWNAFLRGDILAGKERYSVIVIGAPGSMDSPLPDGQGDLKNIAYLMPYAESHAKIQKVVTDTKDPRFGQAAMYKISHVQEGILSDAASTVDREVHWSRVLHIVHDKLESNLTGPPDLEDVWNYLDDLDKVLGGGSEAFWKTVYQGMQLDIDKDMDLDQEAKDEISDQIDEFEANLRRVFRTRGVKATTLGASVSDFGPQVSSIVSMICATKAIPQRIFIGSERGELASQQDKASWDDEIDDRRSQFAFPEVVKPFIQRLIDHNYLPKPTEEFYVAWPERNKMTMEQKAVVAQRLASLNKNMSMAVVGPEDLRDKVLGWPKLAEKVTVPEDKPINGPPPAKQPNKTQQSQGDTTETR